MSAPRKAATLQEKFGFTDGELSTPAHDEMMIWLDANVRSYFAPRQITNAFVEENRAEILLQMKQDCEEGLESVTALLATPRHSDDERFKEGAEACKKRLDLLLTNKILLPIADPVKIVSKVWEKPVMASTKVTVGFVDLFVTTNEPDNLVWNFWDVWIRYGDQTEDEVNGSNKAYAFEVKPKIESAGETIRQIRLYESHLQAEYVIVSPDDRFAPIFESQGIGFMKYPR